MQPERYVTLREAAARSGTSYSHLALLVPSPLTGITPDWYKSAAYRARVVREPRAVLREFGLELPESVDVQVVDTSQERRCLVLPKRPPLSEGLPEEELAALVTRDSLFGVAEAAGAVGA